MKYNSSWEKHCQKLYIGQFSTKGEIIQFSRHPPLAWITLWALPSRDSSHLLFNSNENSFIDLKLCSREKWLICSKPGFLLIQAQLQLKHGLRTGGEESRLKNTPNAK